MRSVNTEQEQETEVGIGVDINYLQSTQQADVAAGLTFNRVSRTTTTERTRNRFELFITGFANRFSRTITRTRTVVRTRIMPAIIVFARRVGLIWGIRLIAFLLVLIGIKFSTGLCLIAFIVLMIHEISVRRMDGANRRVEDHNRTLGRRCRGRENGVGYWEALGFTCRANYYWFVPVVIIGLLLTMST